MRRLLGLVIGVLFLGSNAVADGVPKDIVPLVLLLASDKSSYTTGQVISISGGYAM